MVDNIIPAILQLPAEMIFEIGTWLQQNPAAHMCFAMTCKAVYSIILDVPPKNNTCPKGPSDIGSSIGVLLGRDLINSMRTTDRWCTTCRIFHRFENTSSTFNPLRPHHRIYDQYADLPKNLWEWNKGLELPKHQSKNSKQLRTKAEWRQRVVEYYTHPDDRDQPTVLVVRHTLANVYVSTVLLRLTLDYTNHFLCRHTSTGHSGIFGSSRLDTLRAGGRETDREESYTPTTDPTGRNTFTARRRMESYCRTCTTKFICSIKEERSAGWTVTIDAHYKLTACVPLGSSPPPELIHTLDKWVKLPHETTPMTKLLLTSEWPLPPPELEGMSTWERISVKWKWDHEGLSMIEGLARLSETFTRIYDEVEEVDDAKSEVVLQQMRSWWEKMGLKPGMWSGCPRLVGMKTDENSST